jgi:hypothetical protein
VTTAIALLEAAKKTTADRLKLRVYAVSVG